MKRKIGAVALCLSLSAVAQTTLAEQTQNGDRPLIDSVVGFGSGVVNSVNSNVKENFTRANDGSGALYGQVVIGVSEYVIATRVIPFAGSNIQRLIGTSGPVYSGRMRETLVELEAERVRPGVSSERVTQINRQIDGIHTEAKLNGVFTTSSRVRRFGIRSVQRIQNFAGAYAFVDNAGRVYVWLALDRDPELSPIWTFTSGEFNQHVIPVLNYIKDNDARARDALKQAQETLEQAE